MRKKKIQEKENLTDQYKQSKRTQVRKKEIKKERERDRDTKKERERVCDRKERVSTTTFPICDICVFLNPTELV